MPGEIPSAVDAANATNADDAKAVHGYSIWHRLLEMFGIASAYTMVSWLTYRFILVVTDAYLVGETARGHWLAATLTGALLAGYVLADFGSGMVHWAFDRFGTVDTPLLGAN